MSLLHYLEGRCRCCWGRSALFCVVLSLCVILAPRDAAAEQDVSFAFASLATPHPPVSAVYARETPVVELASNAASVDDSDSAVSSLAAPTGNSTTTTTTAKPTTTTTTTTVRPTTTTTTTTTTSAPTASVASSGIFIGAVVGGVVGALAVALAIGLVCTYCACCRCCGGGCRAPVGARSGSSIDDDDNNTGSSYTAMTETDISSMASKRSFTRTRVARRRRHRLCHRDESSRSSGRKRGNNTASPRSDSSPRAYSESDPTGLQSGWTGREESSSSSPDGWSDAEGGEGDAQGHGHRYPDEVEVPMAAVTHANDADVFFWEDAGQHLGSLQALPSYPRANFRDYAQNASLQEAAVSAILDMMENHHDEFSAGAGANFDVASAAEECLFQSNRSMLTEANVERLHSEDEEARLRAVGSIRYHQSQGMSEDGSVLLHLYRHKATSDPAFGDFLEVKDDLPSD